MIARFVVFAALFVVACASPPRGAQRVAVAPGVTMELPAPAALGRSVEAVQLVTARRDGEIFAFEARLSATPERLLLVGTDAMGRRLMRVVWQDGGLSVERADWLPEAVRPENVLADVMLLYWPEEALRPGLSGAALDGGSGRHLRRDGEEVVVIAYDGDPWQGGAVLRNLAWGYEIEVRSALVGPP